MNFGRSALAQFEKPLWAVRGLESDEKFYPWLVSPPLFSTTSCCHPNAYQKVGTRTQAVVKVDQPVRKAGTSPDGGNEHGTATAFLDLEKRGCLQPATSRWVDQGKKVGRAPKDGRGLNPVI